MDHHRVHHDTDETYGFALSATYPDIVLRTAPDPSLVEASLSVPRP